MLIKDVCEHKLIAPLLKEVGDSVTWVKGHGQVNFLFTDQCSKLELVKPGATRFGS